MTIQGVTAAPSPALIETSDLPNYPYSVEDRLDSHFFIPWERRRWLNSDMRLQGSAECRAHYFDLIQISYDQSPVGTLPDNRDLLAKMLYVDPTHFKNICRIEFGPLHKWQPCLCGDEVRLMHPFVVKTLSEAFSRRADNRAKNEAANMAKRLLRLRNSIAGLSPQLAQIDAAILYMDEWLLKQGCRKRTHDWHQRAVAAWNEYSMARGLIRARNTLS